MTLRFRQSCLLPAVVLFSLLIFGVSRAAAQNVFAAVHGTVTDSTGAVVPHAQVTITNLSTGITVTRTTDDKGYYIVPQIQAGGPYTVTITATGFAKFQSAGLTLNVNDNRDVDATLQIGGTAQTVQVNASALQVETSDTQLKQTVSSDQLEQIPLEGRDPAGFGKFQPGVVESSDRFGSFSSNGSQSPQNSFLLDGTDINDGPLQDEGIQVNPDALAETDLLTSTMNPEFSRNSGQVVNEVIKAGTNRFHGNAFEYYRDTFLTNGDYFSKTRPVFHQNLYGGTLGGPVLRNKFFFFAGYQGFRNTSAATSQSLTMSPANFGGDFSNDINFVTGFNNGGLSPNPIPFDIGACAAGEAWSDCFPSGTVSIPQADWDPIAAKIVQQFIPKPNKTIPVPLSESPAGAIYEYNFNAGIRAVQDQGIVRLDYTPTSRDSIWASSVIQSSPSTNDLTFGGGSFPGFASKQSEHFKIFSASWTHTFSPTLLNELRAGYFRFNFHDVEPTTITTPSSYGFAINPDIAQSGLPYMSIAGLFNLGFSYEGPQPRKDTNLTFADNFSMVWHGHSLKFGASYEQFRVDNPFAYLNNGYYQYAGGTGGGGTFSSGDPLLDFVMGIPDLYEQTSDGFINALASERYAYAQDNWKISKSFTLNYGLAWDIEQPNQNRQFGGLGIVCWQNSNSESKVFPGGPPGLSFPGDPGCNSAGSPTTHYDHFGPRVGFAWSPESGPSRLIGTPGAHDFSIRAGFGIYFNRDQEEQTLQNLLDPPFLYISQGAADFGGSPAFGNPFADVAGRGSESNPFPYHPPAVGGAVNWSIYNLLRMATFDRNYNVPYSYNFNLNIQRSLPGSIVAQIGYVGAQGRRLATWYEGDPITPAGHAACLAGAVPPGFPAQDACNTALSSSIHEYFPQFTAQPAIVPGTGNGAIPFLPNGLPWYASIGAQNTEGISNYNSLQASLVKAPTHGLQFSLAYTYAHALDSGSGYESVTGGDNGYGNAGRVYISTPGFQYLNYGDSDFDARHRLAGTYIYVVPITAAMRSHLLLREALSGWELAGVTALQTGFPVAVSMGQDRSLWCDGFSNFGCGDVPETSSFRIKTFNPRKNASNQWFDTTPFSPEPLGTYGNVKRNFFHGPGFNYTNLQVSKNLPINADGSRYVQFRLEAFNAFNHANFAPPNGNFSSPSFGLINSVIQSAEPNADPQPGRAIQLAGKFYF